MACQSFCEPDDLSLCSQEFGFYHFSCNFPQNFPHSQNNKMVNKSGNYELLASQGERLPLSIQRKLTDFSSILQFLISLIRTINQT